MSYHNNIISLCKKCIFHLFYFVYWLTDLFFYSLYCGYFVEFVFSEQSVSTILHYFLSDYWEVAWF